MTPAAGPTGNRLWRVETPAGPALQKYYASKAGSLRDAWRGALSLVIRGATGSSPAARRRTERETLALWRGAGIDVPADLTDRFPALAGEDVLLLEWIEGKPLDRVLAACGPDRAARDALLRRFAEAWGRRHRIAVERADARFVQFHAGLMHVLVAGERLVSIDLEQAYLPGRATAPRLAREVGAVVKSLSKCGDEAAFRADLAVLVAAHPDRALLAAAARRALGGAGRFRGGRKGDALGLLAEALGPS
jgi:hypothetical protein